MKIRHTKLQQGGRLMNRVTERKLQDQSRSGGLAVCVIISSLIMNIVVPDMTALIQNSEDNQSHMSWMHQVTESCPLERTCRFLPQ